MESPILKQIVKFLQTRKKQKQWMVVFVFMAVIVGVGTVTALKMMGQAMTRKEHVLDCQLQVHQHTKNCYDGNNNLVCGYADYVVHKHNDDCYNSEGKLVCRLPEVEKHEHTKKCYEKTKTLVCGQEESAGHEHTDGCYTTQKGALDCKKEEHQHNDGCYDEEGNLVCGMEEHQHNDDCYKYEDVLTCKIKEGEGGHKLTDKCYDVQEVLTCGKLEMHKHTDKCFEKIDKNGKDEPENLKLVCKKTELLEHTHTEDAGCLRTVDAAEADVIQAELDKEAEEAALDKAAEEGREIFTTDMNEEEENGEDAEAAEGEESEAAEGEDAVNPEGEAAEDEEGAAADEAEPETYEETKTYEGLGYIVTASYNKDANIPEEAKFVAERITKESDEEDYKKHEEEYKKSVADEKATMSALFKIGFYVDGEEVEPASPVAITIQFIDKNGLPEGAPIKVVHFGDDETEVIDGSKAESGSTSFKTKSFSKFAVGYEEGADAKNASVHISESYEYEEEMFHVVFYVEGDVKIPKSEEENDKTSGEERKEASDIETGKGEVAVAEDDILQEVAEDETLEEGAKKKSDEKVLSNDNEDKDFSFDVSPLDENSEKYQVANAYVEDISEGSELLFVHALQYSMTYKDVEVDLSQCDVTAKVTPTEKLSEYAEGIVIENAAEEEVVLDNEDVDIEIDAVSVSTDMEVKKTGSMLLATDSDDENMDVSASDGVMAFGVRSLTNPTFNVQYYAWLNRINLGEPVETEGLVIADSGWDNKPFDNRYQDKIRKNILPFINTKGKKLPTNGTVPATTGISLDSKTKKVLTNSELTEVYKQMSYQYIKAPAMKYFNILSDNSGYTLKAVWILKENCSPDSINKDDWEVIPKDDFEKLHFTNRQSTVDKGEEGERYILIDSTTVIRLVYDITEGSRNQPATFFDYDISDGQHLTAKTVDTSGNNPVEGKVMKTNVGGKGQGINSTSNCNNTSKYAFGNNNAGTPYGQNTYNGHRFNMTNKYKNTAGAGYAGCSFGLVSKASGDNVIFNVAAPKVFGSGEQSGKYIYEGKKGEKYSLDFSREGDTYTLSSVRGTNASNLEKFEIPGGHDYIRTNNFWPMDGVHNADIHFGNDITKQGYNTMCGTKGYYRLPASDDGADHNCYFGMYYKVKFDLDEAYRGPLEYLFYGDDDMWVFLDDELVCDIGGVHSSVGEYVDLWDYLGTFDENGNLTGIKNGNAGEHVLKIFYTERGASGSSCWMQFTLPSIKTMTPEITESDYGTLRVDKEVVVNKGDVEGIDVDRDTFTFDITLTGTKDDHPYIKYDKNNQQIGNELILWDGATFTLKNGEYIVIRQLPVGVKYTITEHDTAEIIASGSITPSDYDYKSDIQKNDKMQKEDVSKDKIVEGTIVKEQEDKIKYKNKIIVYNLPETGGPGPIIYTMAGVLVILTGAGFMYTKKARERRV